MSSYSYERVHIPVQYGSRETTGQWMVDPGDGREKYRLRIPIEGFHQNEVSDGFLFWEKLSSIGWRNRFEFVSMGINCICMVNKLKIEVK